MIVILVSLLIPRIVFASGTTEQYTIIWLVILSPIWGSFLIWLILQKLKRSNKSTHEKYRSNIKSLIKQSIDNSKETGEDKELLIKSIEILHKKGYSIKALKFGWKVIAPNGTCRNFYEIEFLHSFALVQ